MAGQGGRSRRPSFTVADWTAAAWWVGSRNVSRRVVDPPVRQDRDSHCSFGIGLHYAILSSPVSQDQTPRATRANRARLANLDRPQQPNWLDLVWFD